MFKTFQSLRAKKGFREIQVSLKYSEVGKSAIIEIDRVSKPGKRMYSSISDLKEYYKGLGVYILSTSKGVVSDRDAVKFGVGGEVMCKVF
jgi:small subunit ribosomal protein S8